MRPYEHRAQYYETDQMGIIHHSNYIRWIESARIDFMNQMDVNYRRMEEAGIISPVLSVSHEYKSMVKFDDVVLIEPKIKSYNGIKLSLEYTITDKATGEVRTIAESAHCFLDKDRRPVSLKRSFPDFHNAFMKYV